MPSGPRSYHRGCLLSYCAQRSHRIALTHNVALIANNSKPPATVHRRSLERFAFDSVLLPWNWLCARHPTYAADFEARRAM